MNKLAYESSPYLLQHKNNPVDWYPWGNEALQKAQMEDKPIILSVGYSTCHWCHVMAHESFEDHEVAEIMNHYFVCIKLDREERPDIDGIYMDAIQNMGLRGGWPLNVFLMPDTKPFYGGTYFPKKNWINLLLSVSNSYKTQKEKLQESANGFYTSLNVKESDRFNFGKDTDSISYSENEVNQIQNKLQDSFDPFDGGMKRSPKFPMPSIWAMILDASTSFYNQNHENQLKLTLERIILGGIFDHISGGWCRYSTDEKWKVPHFEKMLYDNGQLLSLVAKANLFFSNDPDFKKLTDWAALMTISWLNTEMKSPDGGFFSALDADSEGEEGKYYVWNKSEIVAVLGDKAEDFCINYNITEKGNWENQNNILHLEKQPPAFWEMTESHKVLKLNIINRPKPGLDSKILSGWNALILNGLVDVGRFTNANIPAGMIEKGFAFFQDNFFVKDGKDLKLKHQVSLKDNPGFLEDYAATIQAFINYYQYCFEEKFLDFALQLSEYVIANFFDEKEQLFYFTDKNSEKLIARKTEIFDNVIPSSNSMMVRNLYLLGRIFENTNYTQLAESIFQKIKPLVIQDPQWLSNWASIGYLFSSPKNDIVVVGQNYHDILGQIQKHKYLANALYFGAESKSELPHFEGRFDDGNQTKIYICIDNACLLPVDSVEDAIRLLNG
ncbi:MAG: thioredoxin domain-containing protein [Bacteroidetes bacterium]|nr:thioredoxin domain-containing protein [Bacteroidota bacterium]